ncbi:hypothetical protein [Zunongwangia sp. HGR-M22]|uniref:hypothetical protein n=1 Tax=Zunongwangia sp. HGR-M22 TaxID=3015168 RepID=UPI0022DDD1EA|nr:hypothetical protein [Zunongwangia sp. HGR-M22]WBL25099.1 hypothetical protein PBT91_14495 [Zunongwangia sp. HGR-M22]
MKPFIQCQDIPENGHIEDDHYGVQFDYFFMGRGVIPGQIQNVRNQPKPNSAELLLFIEVIDHLDHKFIRKERCSLLRKTVKTHIEERIRVFMRDLDISPVFIRGLMRNFEVTSDKCKEWDEFSFDRLGD